MGKLLEEYKSYVKNTPIEQRKKDMKKIYEKYNFGPSVDEYFNNLPPYDKYYVQDESDDSILLYCNTINEAMRYVNTLNSNNKLACYIVFNYITGEEVYRSNNNSFKI